MKSVNVSAGGAYLRLDNQPDQELPPVGAELRFVVTTLDTHFASEQPMTAEVVRKTDAGMAIRFLPID